MVKVNAKKEIKETDFDAGQDLSGTGYCLVLGCLEGGISPPRFKKAK
jgi:hypothetical protein